MRGFIDVLLVAAFLFPSSIPYRVAAISIPYLYINDPNIQSHNSSDLEISNLDHTTVPDSIDPFFGCVPSFKGPKLNENSALLISLDAALQLALEDLDALLGETVYKLDSHPEVQIIIRPDRFLRHGKLPQRFAVWGLNIAIDLMIQTRNFQSATFLLTYSGRALATIEFSVTEGRDGVPARLWNVTQDVISLVQPYNRTTWLDIVDPNTNITKDRCHRLQEGSESSRQFPSLWPRPEQIRYLQRRSKRITPAVELQTNGAHQQRHFFHSGCRVGSCQCRCQQPPTYFE